MSGVDHAKHRAAESCTARLRVVTFLCAWKSQRNVLSPVLTLLPTAAAFVMNDQADLLLAVRFDDDLSSFETH